MKTTLFPAASVLAFALISTPAAAQHEHMTGMTMPMHKKEAPPKRLAGKPVSKNAPDRKRKDRPNPVPGANAPTGGMAMPMGHGETEPTHASPTEPGMSMPMDHSHMDHRRMSMPADHREMNMGEHASHNMDMTGALGPYPMTRESSGTSWQPDASEHMGLMNMSGGWTLMAHGVVNFVYDSQSGPRGGDEAFTSGMLMGMASHPFGNGTVQFKAMLSPDPLMGPRGYPLLLATGETADGRTPLLNRQHPHDFFIELSGSVSQNIGDEGSIFFYAGLPGEPAFGPPAFMHRESIMDSPEAPITHHWLDSTHISFGVVTAGLVLDRVKLEISRFNGREPDQHRWDIETGPLNSTAIRLSWNPTRTLALQGSWGHFVAPEQLEPGVNQKRLSASALWANEIAPGWKAAATLAWGRKTIEHHDDDAFAAEASIKHAGWTVFGRGEVTENRELLGLADHGPAYRVGKISVGAVRDFRIADHLSFGAGGLFAVNFVPEPIAPVYGGTNPRGLMAFMRLKLD